MAMPDVPKQPWDDPDHKWYGPVRRMWLVLAYLGLGEAKIDGEPWQESFMTYLELYPERDASVSTLREVFNGQS